GNRTFAYITWDSGDSGRDSDSDFPVFHKPWDYGKGQPGHQRGSVPPCGIAALCDRRYDDPGNVFCRTYSWMFDPYWNFILVFRNRAWRRNPYHRLQSKYVQGPGH